MISEAELRAEMDVCHLLARAFENVPVRETLLDERMAIACARFGKDDMADVASSLAKMAAEATEDDMRAMRIDYTRICCGASDDAPLPYSSIYSDEGRLLKGSCCAALVDEYAQNGFVPRETESNEPEDFLPTLLDYLAFLCEKACAAIAEGDEVQAEKVYAKARAFKAVYVDAWALQYCAEARDLIDTPYYQGILDILEAYCAE